MMPAERVVVFDLDDTLYPEQQFVASGLRAVGQDLAERHGVAQAPEILRSIHSEAAQRGRVFDAALTRLGLDASAAEIQRLVALYRNHQPSGLALFADARDLLERLKPATAMAMVTDGWQRCQRAKLTALGIAGLFDPVIATFDRGADWHKPSPKAFQEVMAAHGGGAPGKYVYVADNPSKDFGGPAALGWGTVQIIRPDGVHRSAPDVGHRIDLVVEDLREILDWLQLG